MQWFKDLLFRLRTGYKTEYLGKCDEKVIRYKDWYISLLINVEGDKQGEIASIGYMDSPPAHYPLRDIIQTNKPKGK